MAGFNYSILDSKGRVIASNQDISETSWTMMTGAIAAGETYTVRVAALPANDSMTVEKTARFVCNYISGDFIMSNGVVTGYTGQGGDIVIPVVDYDGNAIIAIGAAAFKDNADITSVYIPGGVKTIGDSAFEGCSNLESASIPAGIKKIGRLAFYNCERFVSICLVR